MRGERIDGAAGAGRDQVAPGGVSGRIIAEAYNALIVQFEDGGELRDAVPEANAERGIDADGDAAELSFHAGVAVGVQVLARSRRQGRATWSGAVEAVRRGPQRLRSVREHSGDFAGAQGSRDFLIPSPTWVASDSILCDINRLSARAES